MARTTDCERPRNQYAANCCICTATVEPGAGWLYLCTKARPHHPGRGSIWARFPKKVKCDACHQAGYTSKADLLPKGPRRWSVTDVRKWTIESNRVEVGMTGAWDGRRYEWIIGTVIEVFLSAPGGRRKAAGPDIISGHQSIYLDRNWPEWAGRAFTDGAWDELERRINEAIES